jgi:hypothetical protein
MKKTKKTPPPKPPRPNLSKARHPKKIGGDSDDKEIAKLKKDVGFIATGDVAAKAMILGHYLNCSMLFAQQINERFEQDRSIQRKLKIDFKNDLLAYVQWVNAPGNQVPLHPNARLPKNGHPDLKQHVGFRATGMTAAKAIILGYYHPYAHLFQEVICGQFEQETVIQMTLKKIHKNNLYTYLDSLYCYK